MTDLEKLKEKIAQHVIIKKTSNANLKIVGGNSSEADWIVDFRAILFDAEFLSLFSKIFWDTFEHQYPFQIGGQETTAIGLIAALSLEGAKRNKPINAFYIRKSRKPEGLQKLIEGHLTDEPVILID